MAALVLSVAGAAAGGACSARSARSPAALVGALAGNVIDNALFGARHAQHVEGPRLADLDVMASTEGAPIPRLYGRARLAGQMIWATRARGGRRRPAATATAAARAVAAARGTTTTTTYSYFANFAVGLCEGPIGHVSALWADGKPLDLVRRHHARLSPAAKIRRPIR